MYFNLKIVAFLLVVFLLSCKSSNDIVASNDKNNNIEQEVTMTKEDLLNEGYFLGTVKYLKNSKCPYIILDERTNTKFDPINLEEDNFAKFKKDNAKVYYKFYPLRMMNRCNEAQPISLADIKKRED